MPQSSAAEAVETIQSLARQITASGRHFDQIIADFADSRRDVEEARDGFRKASESARRMLEELRALQESRLAEVQVHLSSALGASTAQITDALSRSLTEIEAQRDLQRMESAAWREQAEEQVRSAIRASGHVANERLEALDARYADALARVQALTLQAERFDQNAQASLDAQARAWSEFLADGRALLARETQEIPQAVRSAALEAAQTISLRVEAQLTRIEGVLLSQKQRVEAAEQNSVREQGRIASLAGRIEVVSSDLEGLVGSVRDLSSFVSANLAETNRKFNQAAEQAAFSQRRWWRKQAVPGASRDT